MKSYQEMAEAVFQEGDARLANHKKRRKAAVTASAVCLAAAVCLAFGGWMRRTIVGKTPKSISTPVPSTEVAMEPQSTTERTVDNPTAPVPTEKNGAITKSTTQPPTVTAEPRQQDEPVYAESHGGKEPPPVTENPTAPMPTESAQTEPAAPSNPSGASSYVSGWARFPRWPGYEDKFWVYFDGRTYRCDPFAGRPLETGEYLCALSDCPHDFADEDGAGVYAMMENGAPVPVNTAVVIVFPDGGSYAMIREDTE
ncbi:MAG: hypothetical protein IJK89_04490 [Clostridia bacterium]|nr:hypothetical protein [Clostridia bacterium]